MKKREKCGTTIHDGGDHKPRTLVSCRDRVSPGPGDAGACASMHVIEQTGSSRAKLWLQTAGVVLLVLGIGAAIWIYQRGLYLFSHPATPRDNPYYEHAFAPAVEPDGSASNFFATINVHHEPSQIRLDFQYTPTSLTPQHHSYTLHRTPASQPVQLGNGSIRLACVATAYAVPKTNFDYSIKVPARFFSADLKSIPAEQTAGIVREWDRTLDFQGMYPATTFYFVATNLPVSKQLGFQAFDARTRRSLTQGYSSSYDGNSFWWGSELSLWHQTPIEVVISLAVGPVQTFTVAPREGAELNYPGGVLKLVAATNGFASSSSTSYHGSNSVATFRVVQERSYAPGPASSFVFLAWPRSSIAPIEIEFIDSEDKVIQSAGGSSSDQFLVRTVRATLSDVKNVRLKYYPGIHRIVFTLPELPGLPEENRNLENLFDTHIPYMRFTYEHDLQQAVSQLLAMDMPHLPITYPNGLFPLVYTDTTPRQLFLELDSRLPNPGDRLVANSTENKIKIQRPPWRMVLDRLEKLIR